MSESLRDVKIRISSTKKTNQITKAMYMVSSSKVKRSERTYKKYQDFEKRIADLVVTVLDSGKEEAIIHPMLSKREVKKVAYLLISSDTGLAGGYNNNVFKYFDKIASESKEDFCVGAIGRKAYAYAKSKNYELLNQEPILVRDDVMFIDIVPLAKKFVELYLASDIDKLVIIYNHYVNSLTQETTEYDLLPLTEIKGDKLNIDYLFEQGVEETLRDLLPMFIQAKIYGIILDAKTAEHSARMNAMKNASDNADEIIEKLQVLYNRARQSAITTELTDIIAGAKAVE